MTAGVALYLAAVVAIGVGCGRLAGGTWRLEERLAAAPVIGTVAVGLPTFAFAWAFGLDLVAVLLGAAVAAVPAGVGFASDRGSTRREGRDLVARWSGPASSVEHPWPLAALVAVAWPYTVRVLGQAYERAADGVWAGHLSVWADWQAHLTYASSFAYADNFPPALPTAIGHDLGYHFGVDFFAATLVPLGADVTDALVITSAFLALAFPALLYLCGVRLLGSRRAALIGTAVFLLAGGLGFAYLVGDIDDGGLGVLFDLPREYTTDRDRNYWLINPVVSYLFPQRPTLIGFPVALIAAVALWEARGGTARRPLVAAGVLAGASTAYSIFGFGTAAVLGGIGLLLARDRRWWTFVLPAVALGAPVIAWMHPPESSIRILLGWMASTGGHDDNVVWFWLKNTGLFIPLLLAANLTRRLLPRGLAVAFAPLWLWFLVPNVVAFHQWEWNNTHYFAFWTLFGSLLIGALLASWTRRSAEGRVLAAGCLAVLVLAGGLDLARTADYDRSRIRITDLDGEAVGVWARSTDTDAVFAIAARHEHPVTALAGRQVVVGFPGWIADLGVQEWPRLVDDATTILRGGAAAGPLIDRYGVDYVVIGPLEAEAPHGVDGAWWQANGDVAFRSGAWTVYAT